MGDRRYKFCLYHGCFSCKILSFRQDKPIVLFSGEKADRGENRNDFLRKRKATEGKTANKSEKFPLNFIKNGFICLNFFLKCDTIENGKSLLCFVCGSGERRPQVFRRIVFGESGIRGRDKA